MTEDKIKEAAIAYGNSYDDVYGTKSVATDSFEFGALSQEAKDFHTQEMYSEEEIIELMGAFDGVIKFARDFNMPVSCVELFEQNKKK